MGIGTAIVVLIVIGVVIYLAWSYLQIPTPTNDHPPPPQYKNDIITVEDISITNSKPYAGSITTIEFYIKNNGNMEVYDLEVNFFSVPGFTVKNIICEGESPPEGQVKCDKNQFDTIDPLDTRRITLVLQAPSKDIITVATPYTISYYVKYNCTGYRMANIPVIDDETRREPFVKFSQSDPTYGPVHMDFEPPVGREIKEDSKTITEYWIVGDRPFEMKLSFKHIGSSSVGDIQSIKIMDKDIILTTSDLKIGEVDGELLPCDFSGVTPHYSSEKNVSVPGELMCNFQSTVTPDPEISATVSVEFNYTYQYIRTETLTVQPLPRE